MELRNSVPIITTTEAKKLYKDHIEKLRKANYYEKQTRENGYVDMADLLIFAIENLKDKCEFFRKGFCESPIEEIRND